MLYWCTFCCQIWPLFSRQLFIVTRSGAHVFTLFLFDRHIHFVMSFLLLLALGSLLVKYKSSLSELMLSHIYYWKLILSAWHPIRWRLTNISLKPLHVVFLQLIWKPSILLHLQYHVTAPFLINKCTCNCILPQIVWYGWIIWPFAFWSC